MTTRTPDPFRLDRAALEAMVSDAVVRRGLAAADAGRVLSLSWTAHRLNAGVMERRSPRTRDVVLHASADGQLTAACTCGAAGPLCVHAVAALAAYRAQQEVTAAQTRQAWDDARQERIDSARQGVEVRPRSEDGRWEARSLRSGSEPHRVTFFGGEVPIHSCTCVDFAINRLGTCKHIEAVRSQGSDVVGDAMRARSTGVIYLRWDPGGDAQIALHRWPGGGRTDHTIDRCFDQTGTLQVSVDTMLDAIRSHQALTVHPEVLAHAEGIRDRQAKQAEVERIHAALTEADGRMEGLEARLYPYQIEGVAFLAATGRAILADDMGLGKTVQTIAAVTWLVRDGLSHHALVVCPASIKWQWAAEIKTMTGEEAVVVDGPPKRREAAYGRRARWTIVNYELVLRDRDIITDRLAPDLLVLDEAQRVRNWRTKTATAIKRLETARAFLLTGTPLENRLEDLYSLLQVVDQRLAGPLWQFGLHFHVTDARGRIVGYRNLGALRERVRPVLLRRERRLVATQLPACVVQQRDLPLAPGQRRVHARALREASRLGRKARERGLTGAERNALMSALQRARMACDAAALVDEGVEGAPKLVELRRLLEELCLDAGRKVVVFSEWERMTRMAQDVAEALDLGSVRLHGKVPASRRARMVSRFWEDPDTQVFFATDAGSVGLNLQCASAVVILDLPWNPAVLDQRIGRVHRLGQTSADHVDVILLVTTEGYEGRMAQTLQRKRALFEGVLASEGGPEAVTMHGASLGAALQTLSPEPDGTTQDAAGALKTLLDAGVAAPPAAEAPRAAAEGGDPSLRRGGELLEEGAFVAAIEAFLASMLQAVTTRSGRPAPEEGEGLAAWLYGEIVPTGAIDGRDAGFVLRAEALAAQPDVDRSLAQQVQDDARRLWAEHAP